MNDPSEGILVLELAYQVSELSRLHAELLGNMRSFRAQHNGKVVPARALRTLERSVEPQAVTGRPSGSGDETPPDSGTIGAERAQWVIARPRPLMGGADLVANFPKLWGQERPEPSASEPSETTEPSLKRDYDYFAELDMTLAQLQPVTPRPAADGSPGSGAHTGEAPTPAVGGGPADNGSDPLTS